MRHFGLIGKRLSHSFSQKFFTAKFSAEEIDADYSLFEIERVEDVERLIAEHDLSGFNVTIPYKQDIIPLLDELSEEAKSAGAVNCVVIESGKKRGYNTDIAGIEASLEWLDIEPGMKALILGTGGASKALQYVLNKYDIAFSIVSRDSSRGDYTYDKLTADVIREHNIIINTTPVGMYPDTDSAPTIDYNAITPEHCVLDMIYNPPTTQLLSRAKERGAKTMGGMLMLQTQAIASWHIWQGVTKSK